MALERTKYGIEFDAGEEEESSSGSGWIVVGILLAAAIAFCVVVAKRISGGDDASPPAPPVSPQIEKSEAPAPAASGIPRDTGVSPGEVSSFGKRPKALKNLLMRLDVAAKNNDIEMQAATIEKIMVLPGDPAADLADELVSRLGLLNRKLLFDLKTPLWVAETEVRSGDSASRIAHEHGSTLASFLKLNSISDADMIAVGRKVKVLNHPRFHIIVRKRSKTLDLYLNGKLFSRYVMPESAPHIKLKTGVYSTPANLGDFLKKSGLSLKQEDLAEIELLVPRDSRLNASDT